MAADAAAPAPRDPKRVYSGKSQKELTEGRVCCNTAKWNISGSFTVGYHTAINGTLKVRGHVVMGSFCAVGDDCRLIAASHDTQVINLQIWLQQEVGSRKGGANKGPITIEDNVWIGDGVKVMSGVTIGAGAVLAAGAVVTRDVEPYSITAGSPSRQMRYRFTESVRCQLLDIAWWHWDEARMCRNLKFFDLTIGPNEDVNLRDIIVE
jgi:virginiamycin A acetyltransferase